MKSLIWIMLLMMIGGAIVFAIAPQDRVPTALLSKPADMVRMESPPDMSRATAALNTRFCSPPSVRDADLAALVDRNALNRVTADISAKVPSVRYPEDIPALLAVLTDPKDDDTVRNEVANLLRRSNAPGLTDALLKVLDNPAEGPRFRSFALQHLGQLVPDEQADPDGRERLIGRFVQALDDSLPQRRSDAENGKNTAVNSITETQRLSSAGDQAVRRQALQNLCRLDHPKGKETAIAWLNSTAPDADELRDIAIRCIGDLSLREHIATIRKYVGRPASSPIVDPTDRPTNEVVRIAAIVVLSQWGDEESRPAFEDAARSQSVRLQRCGKAALERLDKTKADAALYD